MENLNIKKSMSLGKIVFLVVVSLILLTGIFAGQNINVYAETEKIDISDQVQFSLGSVSTDYERENLEISNSDYVYKYTGEEICPDITVHYPASWKKDYGITNFKYNEDWTVSYSSNTDVGLGTITVTGIGQFSGTVTKTFNIVSILPSEQRAIDEEKATARTLRLVFFAILCGACIVYAVMKIIKIVLKLKVIATLPQKNLEYLQTEDKTRTEKQKELFYKSARYLEWKQKSDGAAPTLIKELNLITLLSIITLGSALLAFILAFFTDASYFFDVVCVGLVVACLIFSSKSKKHDVTESFNLGVSSITSGIDVCKKCAGDYQLFWNKAKFSNKTVEFVTKTLKEGDKPYIGDYDEVTNMQRVRKERKKTRTVGSGSSARTEEYMEEYFEDVYTIKVTMYWYKVPAICKSCEEKVVFDRSGRNPDELK